MTVSHRRSCSLSSLDSFLDFGLEDSESVVDNEYLWLDEQKSVPPPPESTPRPLRRRLGAEEAIKAASSPEIKALDLPLTPSFPRPQRHRYDVHKNAISSPGSTKSNATDHSSRQRIKESYSSSPLPPLSRKENNNMIPPLSPAPSSFTPFCDNKENSIPSCIAISTNTSLQKGSNPVKLRSGIGRKVFGNRTNIVHPNESSPSFKRTTSGSKKNSNSSHRRMQSNDSLPSTEDLGDDLLPVKQCDIPTRPCLGTIHGESRPRIVRRERILNVTTAFR